MSTFTDDPAVQIYLREIGKSPSLSEEEEAELFQKFRSGDLDAPSLLLRANLGLVVAVVQESPLPQGKTFIDLIAEGNIALMNALKTFHPQRHASFRAYAEECIRESQRLLVMTA